MGQRSTPGGAGPHRAGGGRCALLRRIDPSAPPPAFPRLKRPAGSRGCLIGTLSFAKTPSAGQVVDLSALIRREWPSHDHHAAAPAPLLPVPLRRTPPARPREPRPAPAARRVQEDGGP